MRAAKHSSDRIAEVVAVDPLGLVRANPDPPNSKPIAPELIEFAYQARTPAAGTATTRFPLGSLIDVRFAQPGKLTAATTSIARYPGPQRFARIENGP